jgi:hypothetical protein
VTPCDLPDHDEEENTLFEEEKLDIVTDSSDAMRGIFTQEPLCIDKSSSEQPTPTPKKKYNNHAVRLIIINQ